LLNYNIAVQITKLHFKTLNKLSHTMVDGMSQKISSESKKQWQKREICHL